MRIRSYIAAAVLLTACLGWMPAANAELAPGVAVDAVRWTDRQGAGRYEVVRSLGRGTSGECWLVRDAAGRNLVFKALNDVGGNPGLAGGQTVEQLLRHSQGIADAMAVTAPTHLSRYHPPLNVTSRDREGNPVVQQVIVTDYQPLTLREVLADLRVVTQDPRESARRLELVSQLARQLFTALGELHGTYGLHHRDVNPNNIYLSGTLDDVRNGRARLILGDLDTAVAVAGPARAARANIGNGTQGYVGPARFGDCHQDFYAAATVLHEMAFGTPMIVDYLMSTQRLSREHALALSALAIPEIAGTMEHSDSMRDRFQALIRSRWSRLLGSTRGHLSRSSEAIDVQILAGVIGAAVEVYPLRIERAVGNLPIAASQRWPFLTAVRTPEAFPPIDDCVGIVSHLDVPMPHSSRPPGGGSSSNPSF